MCFGKGLLALLIVISLASQAFVSDRVWYVLKKGFDRFCVSTVSAQRLFALQGRWVCRLRVSGLTGVRFGAPGVWR